MVKPVFSVHLFVFINEACNVLLFIFLIFYKYVDKELELEIDLKSFHTHLVYITLIRDIKIIMIIVFIGIPLRFLSLISWWKWFSTPFIKIANIFYLLINKKYIIFIFKINYTKSFDNY